MCDPNQCTVTHCKYYDRGCTCDRKEDCAKLRICPYESDPDHIHTEEN